MKLTGLQSLKDLIRAVPEEINNFYVSAEAETISFKLSPMSKCYRNKQHCPQDLFHVHNRSAHSKLNLIRTSRGNTYMSVLQELSDYNYVIHDRMEEKAMTLGRIIGYTPSSPLATVLHLHTSKFTWSTVTQLIHGTMGKWWSTFKGALLAGNNTH